MPMKIELEIYSQLPSLRPGWGKKRIPQDATRRELKTAGEGDGRKNLFFVCGPPKGSELSTGG
jgi:hypothetical protein